MTPNTLYYGDNLHVLRQHIAEKSVDLVYLDPPFNSNANYNVLFAEQDGSEDASQIRAFTDTWTWDQQSERTYAELVTTGGKVSDCLQAFRTFLGPCNMLAYLVMMAPRLVALRRVMKPTASIYLHCDPTASHYLKLLMDSIFGADRFRSEIIWKRTTTHSDAQRWSPVADTLFYYAMSPIATWNPQFGEHDRDYVSVKYTHDDSDGRGLYRLDNMTSPNPRPNMMYEWKGFPSPAKGWRYSLKTMRRLDAAGRIWYPESKDRRPQLKRYLSEQRGRIADSIWTDIPPINSQAQERLGYPTQKPLALLERIIEASSNPGDVVLDPFCGCGTTVHAAQKLGRLWVGIDVTHLAVALMKHRLRHAFGVEPLKATKAAAAEVAEEGEYADPGRRPYQVIGEPTSASGATELAATDPYQFQWWALGLVEARPIEQKKGADRGIDGKIVFRGDAEGKFETVVISVKAGKVSVAQVRDLKGVMEREKAAIGLLISMQEPTRPMRVEAAEAGSFTNAWGTYPRLQLLTVAELLEGAKIDMPPRQQVDATFAKAPREKPANGPQQQELGIQG